MRYALWLIEGEGLIFLPTEDGAYIKDGNKFRRVT